MIRYLFIVAFLGLGISVSEAQVDSTTVDKKTLDSVTVKAYGYSRPAIEVPSSIVKIGSVELGRYGEQSFLPVVNSVPGVRMEERSPGSYRFSMRGSLLRSPFGIRNVKFYWNGLPLTDGSGNTYLNLIDFSSVGSIEVIKGPGGSLYGAGTGGVVLLESPAIRSTQFTASVSGGSYGLYRSSVSGQLQHKNVSIAIQANRQQTDGYRQQSAMVRNSFLANIGWYPGSSTEVNTTLLYSDLSYQTPGGLTQAQLDADPRQARPATPAIPGAIAQQAAVYNKTWYAGIHATQHWNSSFSSRLGVFGGHTDFKNPAIRNYESRSEQNFGVRNENQLRFRALGTSGQLIVGTELQFMTSTIRVQANNAGIPGSLFSSDDVSSSLATTFVQSEWYLPHNINVTVAAGVNWINYEDTRTDLVPPVLSRRKFDPFISPRISILKKIKPSWSVYAQLSRGFSPPTIAEIIPSNGVYNGQLNPESGWSSEIGLKGVIRKHFTFSLSAYDFRLQETIVLQRDIFGADFFINSGDTKQLGLEVQVAWEKKFNGKILNLLRTSSSYSYQDYKFVQYVSGGSDFSGNRLTGVPPVTAWFGVDAGLWQRLRLNVTALYTDRLTVNDAATVYANDYLILGARATYQLPSSLPLEVFIGGDNLLDQRYSLGNDLNAAAGRYFNAAAGINFFGGLTMRFRKD